MNKRIVSLLSIYNKLGEYLHKYGDAHVSSISTHCNHPNSLYYTFNLSDLYTGKESKIDIPYIITENKKDMDKQLLETLCKSYIEDTTVDSQLFCGCYPDDCVLYKTNECVNCLKNQIREKMFEKELQTMLKSKMERG